MSLASLHVATSGSLALKTTSAGKRLSRVRSDWGPAPALRRTSFAARHPSARFSTCGWGPCCSLRLSPRKACCLCCRTEQGTRGLRGASAAKTSLQGVSAEEARQGPGPREASGGASSGTGRLQAQSFGGREAGAAGGKGPLPSGSPLGCIAAPSLLCGFHAAPHVRQALGWGTRDSRPRTRSS